MLLFDHWITVLVCKPRREFVAISKVCSISVCMKIWRHDKGCKLTDTNMEYHPQLISRWSLTPGHPADLICERRMSQIICKFGDLQRGLEICKVVRGLAIETADADSDSFDWLTAALKRHIWPTINPTAERHKFRQLKQQPEESVSSFVSRLRKKWPTQLKQWAQIQHTCMLLLQEHNSHSSYHGYSVWRHTRGQEISDQHRVSFEASHKQLAG